MGMNHKLTALQRQAGVLLLAFFPVFPGSGHADWNILFGVKGFVENGISKQPLPGVEIRVDCSVYTGIESSKVKKRATTVTDEEGYFYFSIADVNYCDYTFFQASKPDWVVVSEWQMDNNFPRKNGASVFFSMIPKDKLREYYVQAMKPREKQFAFIIKDGKETPDHAGQFFRNFVNFKCAKRVAKSQQDIRFIKENYCPVLLKELPLFERSPFKNIWINAETPCTHVLGAHFPENRYYADKTAHPESSNKIDIDELMAFCK